MPSLTCLAVENPKGLISSGRAVLLHALIGPNGRRCDVGVWVLLETGQSLLSGLWLCDSVLLMVALGGLPDRLTHHVNGDDQDQGIVLTLGNLRAVRVADPEPFQALSVGAVSLEPRAT